MIDIQYRKWLNKQVNRNTSYRVDLTYHFMLRRLWDRDYYAVIKKDENRVGDGLYLRYTYCQQFGCNLNEPNACLEETCNLNALNSCVGDCKILEMLIAFSNRVVTLISYEKTQMTSAMFFWMLVDNLGLTRFDDKTVAERGDPTSEIDEILQKFLERTYDFNGKGGLFPLKHPRNNQKNVEIWDQFGEYIIENNMI